MSTLVADSSALVSLGTVVDADRDPLSLCVDHYRVLVPPAVVEELREVAAYDDAHGRGADASLEQTESVSIRAVDLDSDFPLDDGENAAVALANDVDADLFLCDEFNHLGLIHASLVDTRVVTSPTLLSAFVRRGLLTPETARRVLGDISAARSWVTNSYVKRARSMLEDRE